jgi:hypothetical protein
LGIAAYGVVRSTGRANAWLLGIIALVALGAGYFLLHARRKSGPIIIYSDRIDVVSWTIPFQEIQTVREDRISATQYVGGRPVISTQRRLVVDTTSGPKAVAYEGTYDIDAVKPALEAAVARYRGR